MIIFTTGLEPYTNGSIAGQDGWTDEEGANIVSDFAHAGSKSVRCLTPPVQSGSAVRNIAPAGRFLSAECWCFVTDADGLGAGFFIGRDDISVFDRRGLQVFANGAGVYQAVIARHSMSSILLGTSAAGQVPFGVWYLFRVDVAFSTFAGATPNADGFVRVYVDDELILEVTDVQIDAATSTDGDWINSFGFDGEGWLDDFELDDGEIPPPTVPPGSLPPIPCCGEGPPTPPGGNPGPGPGPNPTTPLPTWTPFCTGGGVVLTAADIVDSEVWT